MAALLSVLLVALAFVGVVAVAPHVHVDQAQQGVMVLDAKQSAECRTGGGCIAFSDREIKIVTQAAAVQGYTIGKGSCGRKDL